MTTLRQLTIPIDRAGSVSGLFKEPAEPTACFVMAHGAGAGMAHPFMAAVADGLAERGIATLRYQFPYMEQGSRRPDRPALAHATVRAAVAQAVGLTPSLPLVAGGKSFGGRMTSQAQADQPLPGIAGLAFFGFPLHPADKPSTARADHLAGVGVPMLFLHGSRDALAHTPLMRSVLEPLGARARLHHIEGADHGFTVPARSGQTSRTVLVDMLDAFADWVREIGANPRL